VSTRKFNNTDKGLGVVIAIWVVVILANLAFWGVVIWGIIELVQWVTTK
jgi:hypothetical protein